MHHLNSTFKEYIIGALLILTTSNIFAQSQSCGPQPPPPPCYGCPPDPPPPPSPPPPCCTGCICVPVINSSDPNEISGPIGYDSLRWVAKKDRMGFKVLFENDPVFATAPAQIVRITVPIHPSLNMNSLRLGSFGFGPYTFEVPPNRTYYAERLNPLEMLREQERILAELRAAEIERQRRIEELERLGSSISAAGDAISIKDSLGLLVDVIAGINVKKREIFWIFESIDPLTGRAPEEAFRGFLPVNDTLNGSGEGFVNFSIIPNQQVLTGDTSSAKASIVFDINEAIETNIWTNTIDALPPTSLMNPLPLRVAFPDSLELKWTGQDDTGGTGVKNYALYVAKDNGSYYLAADNITGNNYKFRGTPGSVYDFFVQARDQVGNLEPPKNSEGKVSFDLPSRLSARIVSRSDTVCAGNQATIALEGTPGATLRYVSSSSADTISLILTGNVQEIKLPGITNNTTFKLVRVQYLDKITALDTTIQVFVRNQPSTNIIPSDSLFCADQLITLTLQHQTGEISSIVWKQIVTGASYTFTASSSQVIGVQYKDRFGCTYKKEKDISVNQVKVSVATLDNAGNSINSSICEGDNVRLVASGGSSYLWNTGATSPEILVSPSTTTQYKVVAAKAGCKDSVEVKIGINPGLSVQEDIRNTCKNGKTGSISLSISGGTPGFKYLWATGERGNELKDLTAGIYQVEVRDTNGCSLTKSFEITENGSVPTLDVVVPQSLCGETPVVVNLKPSQSMRIEYSVNDGTGQLLDVLGNSQFNLNLGLFAKSLNLKIIKAVSLATGCGIQGVISKDITVNQVKVSVATLDNAGNNRSTNICEGEKVRLVASGGSSYLWNTGATTPEILASPSTTTQYKVVAAKAGCKDSVEVKIGINPGLSVKEDIRNTCKDGKTGSISLSISGGTPGFKYLWATGERGNEVKDLTAGIYQVEVRDTNGCSVTKSFEITENGTAPMLDVTVPPSLCGETPVVVNLKPSQSMRIEYSVDDGTGQLLDVLGNSQFNLNLGIFSKSLNLKIIKAVSLATGCGIQGVISKDIAVISVPQIVSDNQTVCSDLPFTISANMPGNNQLQVFYNWEATYQGLKGTAIKGTALVVGRDIIFDKISNQTNNTVQVLYKVSPYLLVGGQRCNGSPIEIGVRVQPIPDVVLPVNSVTVCSGTPFKVELNGNLAGTSFKWSRNYSGNSISGLGNIEDALENISNVAQEIKYTVFSNIGVCEGPEKTISVRLQPEPKMVVSTPEKICDGFADLTNPKLFVGSDPGLIYSFWRDPNLQQPIANPQKVTPGLYFISAKSSGGCSGLVNVNIQSSFKFQVNAPEPLCQGKLADLTKAEVTKGSDSNLLFSYWQDLSATKELQNPFAVSSGQYYLKATQFRGTENCFTILPITVNENKPKVKNLISDISICSGTEFKFNAELDIEGSIFEWTRSANTGLLNSPSKGIKQIGEVLTLVGNSPVKARYDYNLKTQGCLNQASEAGFFEVNILPAPIISVSDSIEICNPTIDLTNLVASARDITFTFSKDLQGNNRISNPTSFLPGQVFIRGENKSGCKTTKMTNIYSRIAKGIVPEDLVICPPLKSNLQTFAINAGLTEKFTVNFFRDLQNTKILVNPNQVDTGTYYLSIKERSGSSPGCSAIIPVNVKSGLATLDSPLDLTEQCNGSLFNYKPQSRSGNVEFKWKFIGYDGDIEQDLISGNELVEVFLENKSSQIRNAKFQITAKGLTCTNSVSNYLLKVSVLPEVQLGLVDSLINVKSGDIFNIKAELTKQIPLARIDWIANYGGALGGKGKGLQSLPGSQVIREQLFNLSDSTIFATYFLTPLIKGNSYCYGETKLVKVKVLSTPISIPAGINGGIKTNFGIGVEGVELRLSGLNQTLRNFSTNQGLFKFNEIPSGKDYTLLPILDINPLNGISTLDLIKLQHHITGRKPILDPYQLIAADVNNSKSISIADLIELKKLILGLNSKFLNNKSWRFVDNEYKFPNPTNPWIPTFPELKNFNNLFGNQKGSFIGVKIGDLSGDAIANRGNFVSFRSNDPIKLYIDNPKLKKGDKFSVPIKMIGTDELDGIQFSLGFNSKVLKLLPSACVFPKSENVSYFEESALLTFASENNVYAGTELMNLVFEVLEDGYPENWIFLNNRVLVSEGYREYEKFPLELIFEHSKSLNLRPHAFQNFPNPFTKNTTVPFWLPETDLVWIKVFDLTGKLVLEEKDIFNRGYNSFEFKDGQFQNYNSLFYQIGGTNWMESRMMIRND